MGTLVKGNTSLHDHLHIITHLRRPHRTELHSMGHLHTQRVSVGACMDTDVCVCVHGCVFAHMLWANSPSDTCLMVMFRNNHQNDPCAFAFMASHSSSVLFFVPPDCLSYAHTQTHTLTLSLSGNCCPRWRDWEALSHLWFLIPRPQVFSYRASPYACLLCSLITSTVSVCYPEMKHSALCNAWKLSGKEKSHKTANAFISYMFIPMCMYCLRLSEVK